MSSSPVVMLSEQRRTKMWQWSAMMGLLVGSFRGPCAGLIFPTLGMTGKYFKYCGEGTLVSLQSVPPGVIVAQRPNEIYSFLHYNYTVVDCIWPRPMTSDEKSVVFRELAEHMRQFDQALHGNLYRRHDIDAWRLSLHLPPS